MAVIDDIWKRFISGEEIFLRENYGTTRAEKFESSIKTQEINPHNVPKIDHIKSNNANKTYE